VICFYLKINRLMKKGFLDVKFDLKIVLFFVLFFLGAVIYFLVQFFNRVDCDTARFYVLSEHFQNNESIEFYDKTTNADTWLWDFGDNSELDSRQHTFHIYKQPGKYIVSLTVNGNCIHTKEVIITDNNSVNKEEMPTIIASRSITVGRPTYFRGIKEGGRTWEWSFGENRGVDDTSQNPIYTFEKAGEKIITLVANGNFSSVARIAVYVHPKEVKKINPLDVASYEYEKEPEKFSLPKGKVQKDPLEDMLQYIPVASRTEAKKDSIKVDKKAPKISEDQFEILLLKVAEGSKVKDDFEDYLCGNYEIPVVKNGEDLLTFDQLCESIKGKKIRIDAIRLNKDKKTNGVKGLNITYKVKKMLIWTKD
jgi:hypothetical protein